MFCLLIMLKVLVIGGVISGSYCMLSLFSLVQFFVTPWIVVHQAPPSMGFSRQEYWSGLPSSPPGNLPDPGMEPRSPTTPALAGRFFTTSAAWEALLLLWFFWEDVWRGSSVVKNPVQEMQGRFLFWEHLLEEEMATHSSILAWKISWTGEPGWL